MRSKLIWLLLAVLPCCAFPQAQPFPPNPQSRVAGVFVAYNYGLWSSQPYSIAPTSGSQTFTVRDAFVRLPDGRLIVPWNTNAPIRVGTETVTPSAVGAGCLINAPQNTCTVTATFSNTGHSTADGITSATFGLQEALDDAAIQGGTVVIDSAWSQAGGTTAIASKASSTYGSTVSIEDCRTVCNASFGSGTVTVGSQLRTALASATSNWITQGALTVPPAWAATTAYQVGQVVNNGTSCNSGPCEYECAVAGTSAGSGGPTGTVLTGITDNTVTWLYYGQSPISSNSTIAPTITSSATFPPTGLTLEYPAVTGGVANPQFRNFGGYNYIYNSQIFPTSFVQLGGAETVTVVGQEFMTDAPKFAIRLSAANTDYQLIVDGNLVFSGAQYAANTAFPFVIVDYSNAGGRKSRDVLLIKSGDLNYNVATMSIVDVHVDTASTVWYPQRKNNIRVCHLGDSYTEGGGNPPYQAPLDATDYWPFRLAGLMGWGDDVNMATGGTGYIATGAGPDWTYGGAITGNPTIAAGCSAFMFFGSVNDNGYSASAITAAAVSAFQAARAANASAPIWVFGVWGSNSGPATSVLTNEAAVQAAVAQFNDPLTTFFPVSTDPSGPWVSGTGTIPAPTGTGNADFCVGLGAHPSPLCIIQNLPYHFANALKQAIQTIP